MSRFRAVLTDIDGTMARSENVHRDALKQVAKAYYGVALTEQQLDDINGKGAKKRFELVRDEARRNNPNAKVNEAEFREQLSAYFLTHWRQIEPMPGAREFLNHAAEAGMRQAAVTNSQRDIGEVALSSLGTDRRHLEFVVAIDDVAEGKPSPASYLFAAEKMGLSSAEDRRQIIALEDSLVGVEAAKRAGLTVIQIQSDPKHVHPDADLVVTRLDDPRVANLVGFRPNPNARPGLGKAA